MIGYRSENRLNRETRATYVMAFETFELRNQGILITLANSVLRKSFLKPRLKACAALYCNGNNEFYKEFSDGILFFEEILYEVSKVTGNVVNYALWLTDSEEEALLYGTRIKKYKKGEVLLSDLGKEGKLWGYYNFPKPL